MMVQLDNHMKHYIQDQAAMYRATDEAFAQWADGYGVIAHDDLTQVRIYDMVDTLLLRGTIQSKEAGYNSLLAADRIASAAMWLVVHMTYTRSVFIDGRDLNQKDFKPDPEGHTGGSLNMVPAYVGYLAINALSGITRSWLMGQGHCVAAIDATNLIVGNMSPEQAERYAFSDEGLTRFVRDFYSCKVRADGRPDSPLGSHVNPHTAGGLIEGGYLGFAELLYVHMPLPGERLVAFLSDGAFEEQRASDWVPRWWRAEDCGLVAPIMIANGRRIDQRSTMVQIGGVDWFRQHLKLNGFDPIDLDGRDPAAHAWGIYEIEERLSACVHAAKRGDGHYPVPLHYGIAEVPKGYGFPGAGTNNAHNLPLGSNPHDVADARGTFNEGASRLWVKPDRLEDAVATLNTHGTQQRVKERDHALAHRTIAIPALPEPPWHDMANIRQTSPMEAIDQYFPQILQANPDLRPRVGNPDEMRSNRMNITLDFLKHRVTVPEAGVAESIDGGVITALNEEAVVCAALANKGGISLVVSYEAFTVKMLGAIRQDIIFTRHARDCGRTPGWLGIPIIATSHTWENGKNEQSHQDPTFCEAMMGEMSDMSRVVFPADWNSALAVLREVYGRHGQIWTMVTPKRPQPVHFSKNQANQLVRDGAIRVKGSGGGAERVLMIAIGAYQLTEILRASARLDERDISHDVIYMLEPGRFREPRDEREAGHCASDTVRSGLFPESVPTRVVLTHTRSEALVGTLRPLDTGHSSTCFLGYRNRGGTLDTNGMLFANRCTWAHVITAVARCTGIPENDLLTSGEIRAVAGKTEPLGVLF